MAGTDALDVFKTCTFVKGEKKKQLQNPTADIGGQLLIMPTNL